MAEPKSVISIRLGEKTQREVRAYCEKYDMSESDAYRELIDRGLKSDSCEEHLKRIDKRLDGIEKREQPGFISRLF